MAQIATLVADIERVRDYLLPNTSMTERLQSTIILHKVLICYDGEFNYFVHVLKSIRNKKKKWLAKNLLKFSKFLAEVRGSGSQF